MSNTTKKGDAFEQKVFEQLRRLLENDDFFVPGKKSKIFLKKGYESEKRKSEIIFDISIETFLSNAKSYSILTLIECKDLGRKVSVDDIEEFESKIRQVGEHNTKGLFVTTNGFQDGAYDSAKNFGIALLRLASNEEYEWISYRKSKFVSDISSPDISSAFSSEKLAGRNIIGFVNNHLVYNLSDILIRLKVIDFYLHKERFVKFPFISEDRIENIIGKLMKYGVYDNDKLNSDKLCKVLSESYKMQFEFNTYLPNNVLGKIEFDPLKVFVTSSLTGELHRWRFTFAHEIGHLILHSPLLRYSIDEKTDTESSLSLDNNIADATSKQLEFQANLFARHLLMPQDAFLKIVSNYFKQNHINKPSIVLDNQPGNRNTVFGLLSILSNHFDVSLEAAKVRLKALKLLKDATDYSIYNHLRNTERRHSPF